MESSVFAGASSAALKKVHLKRLMAVGVALVACTFVSWELMIVGWAITPYMPVRVSGILGDFLSVLVSLPPCCALPLIQQHYFVLCAGKRMRWISPMYATFEPSAGLLAGLTCR